MTVNAMRTSAHRSNSEVTINNKEHLVKLYADLIDDEMEKLWSSGEWNEQKLESLQYSHFRTKYL